MTRRLGLAALAGLTLAAAVLLLWPPGGSPEPDAADGSAAIQPGGFAAIQPGGFAAIQQALDIAAAGGTPAAADPLALPGAVLAAILAGRSDEAARLMDRIEAEIGRRLPSEAAMAADSRLAAREEWLTSYFELLPDPAEVAPPEQRAIVRLAVLMRKIDAVLLADLLPSLDGYDLVARRGPAPAHVLDGAGLRLPCRLAVSHPALLRAAADGLGKLAGPPADCPPASPVPPAQTR